jgi:HAD superfamily phosphoserine phosphatase-like hydrolase
MLLVGFLYEIGLMPLEWALKKIFKQLQGLSLNDLFQRYKKMPLIQNGKKIFEKLKENECKIALISSGLPQLFIEDLAAQLGAEYAVGLNLGIIDGYLTGDINGDVIQPEGKALALKKILEKEGLKPTDCALVADDRNNLPMFQLCALRVGYNPDFLLSIKSDAVVRGDLFEILPILTGEMSQVSKPHSISRHELIRETIHISGFFMAIISFYFLNHYIVVFLIFLVTLLYGISELARMRGLNLPITSAITWNAANKPEMYEFITAPIFYALGIILALILFSEPVGYASIAILTLGDSFATLFGRKMGCHVFNYRMGKSVEGAFFGFIAAALGATFFVPPLEAFLGATGGMLIENLPLPINDNLTIPIISGLIITLIF